MDINITVAPPGLWSTNPPVVNQEKRTRLLPLEAKNFLYSGEDFPRKTFCLCLCCKRIQSQDRRTQDEDGWQRSGLLVDLPHCSLPGGHPWEQGLSSPLCLLCAHGGALYISVPDLHSRRHPSQRGTHKFRVCGPCLIPSSERDHWSPWWLVPKIAMLTLNIFLLKWARKNLTCVETISIFFLIVFY